MSNSLIILLILIAAYTVFSAIKSRSVGIRLQTALSSGALVVDVRSPQEYASGHFGNAVNIPYDQVERRIAEFGRDKTRTVILYCYAGSRSAAAEKVLRKNGYASVVNARNLENLRKFEEVLSKQDNHPSTGCTSGYRLYFYNREPLLSHK
jgi:phage shock protein E